VKNFNQKLLLTAGPVPVSKAVQDILHQPMIYHRSKEFVEIFNRVTEGLKYFFQTKHDVVILTASGTGGMEAVVTNLFSPGDQVLIVENGKFSERWSQIAERFHLKLNRITIDWGKSVSIQDISNAIKQAPGIKGIFLTHSETSTGALTDIETIVPQVRKLTSALVIVDAVSSAGVLPLKMDRWGIDVAVTASQKGLGLPPGLTMIAINDRAWQFTEQADLPRYYLDFTRARQALRLNHGSAYTPAIPLIRAADIVLEDIQKTGIETIWQQRKQIASTFRDELHQLGFSIFPEIPADSLTVIEIDDPFEPQELIHKLRDQFGIIVSRGQGKLLTKVLRIGHLVNVGETELNQFLHAFKSITQV
jgi:aspartate aminotransferase-like enzyme